MNGAARAFDAPELRQVLGSFVTGVTVITTLDAAGKPSGLTANSFSSVSLDPPLVLWSQSRTAPSHPVFNSAERFAVNILAEDQVEVSKRFARGGIDKFAGCATRLSGLGLPLIEGCAAYLECHCIERYPGGDHVVFLGEVESIERTGRRPLVFGGGRYLVAEPHDLGAAARDAGEVSPNIARLQAVRLATRAMAELAGEIDETLGLGVWGNMGPTIVRWEESSQPLSDNLRTGLVLPLLSSATGLAFAAWLPGELTAPFFDAEIAQVGPPASPDRLAAQLQACRDSGVVRLVGTKRFTDLYGQAISAMSVPIFGRDNAMVLALTAIGAADRLDTSPDGPVLRGMLRCAQALSDRLRASSDQTESTL